MDRPSQGPGLGEEEVIRLIQSLAGEKSDELLVGIGDDAAVLNLGGQSLCVTTDLLVEGVHFDLSYTRAYELGWKAMAVNLSDLAAMGVRPRWGFLSLGLTSPPSQVLVEGVIGGAMELAKQHGLTLAGGDTVRSPQIVINLCLMGAADKKTAPLLRSGARPGDTVCVTGRLGAAAGGLAWLSSGGDREDPAVQPCVQALLLPSPRVAAGRALAQSGRVKAMMDISDGLATDLARLCTLSQAGALVRAESIPLDQATLDLAARLEADATRWALSGGDDYELLFTCAPGDVELMAELVADADPGLAVTKVGEITKGRGVTLEEPDGSTHEIAFGGYDHFRDSDGES